MINVSGGTNNVSQEHKTLDKVNGMDRSWFLF